jgi:phospho-N-acetylmuramoyl-pentapeptide-transferase
MREVAFALSIGGFTFLIVVIWGDPFVEVLRRLRIGKRIRVELAGATGSRHLSKTGTPTMGGLLIVVPVVVITAGLNLVNVLGRTVTGRSILIPLAVMIMFGGLGMLDDWEGIRGSRGKGLGLSAAIKFLLQVLIGLGTAAVLMFALDIHSAAIPSIPVKFDMGLLYLPIATFIIVGTSNAINFTDGLDGLAGIIAASAFAAYGVVALLQGQVFLVRFCFTIVGACFAFLWYNAHPAQLFMGDTGSLALGAVLGTVALMTGQWLILPIIALIPVVEVVSVLLQVISVQTTRRIYGEGNEKRIFRLTPLHHHFELGGWSETQVVQRFWLVGILSAMVGIALALL